jgi:hypothetical protein
MTKLTLIVTLVGEISALLAIIIPMIVTMRKISNGVKCQLRSDMLRIYYHCRDSKTIRQFEYENFIYLYEAYKALKGNSFIDRIYSEVKTWRIET